MFKLFNKTLYCTIFLDSEVRKSTYITKIKTRNNPQYENSYDFYFNLDGHKDWNFSGTMWWYKTEEECLQWIKWNFEGGEQLKIKNKSVCFKTYSDSVKMLNKKKYLADLFEGKDITKSPLSLDMFDENSLEKYEIKNGIVTSVNPHTKEKRNKKDDVGAEALSATTMLLYKKIAIFNNKLESFEKDTKAEQTIYITIYFIWWAVRYCNYEKRKVSDFNLLENEIAPTIYLMDRIFFNLTYRCNDKSLHAPEVYQNLLETFYYTYIKDLYDNKIFNKRAMEGIKVVKKTEKIAKNHLNGHDKVINELINEAVDIFVLKDKDKSETGLKNFYLLWDSLVKNFKGLVDGI